LRFRQRGETLRRGAARPCGAARRGETLVWRRGETLFRRRGETLFRRRGETLFWRRGETLFRRRGETLFWRHGETLFRRRGETLRPSSLKHLQGTEASGFSVRFQACVNPHG
jgi:hypothetical protein